MSANPWTPEQWREYNRQTGDRHVNRRLPPLSRMQALRDDIAQQAELARLSRRAADAPDRFARRERSWIKVTQSLPDGR